MNVVITGTSRGIGLELCRLALAAQHQVCAVARRPDKSKALQNLKSEFPKSLTIAEVDVTDSDAGSQIKALISHWPCIDLLINNAGILNQEVTAENLLNSYHVNTVSPLLLTQNLFPLLKKSTQAKVAQITSVMGSITDNSSGGYYAYRASKAALNMVNKSLSIDQPWLTCLVLHPGWVKTDMGGSGAAVEPEASAQGLWKVINESSKARTGQFFDFRGKSLPW